MLSLNKEHQLFARCQSGRISLPWELQLLLLLLDTWHLTTISKISIPNHLLEKLQKMS